MIHKAIGVIALVLLPFSALLWYNSHSEPYQRRLDVTLYKSLRVYIRDGVCSFRLLNMPSKTASRSEFAAPLSYDATPGGRSLLFSSTMQGPYRITWLVFPLWLSTTALTLTIVGSILFGPARRWQRLWRGLCLECGYDLTGNRSGRCSECGTACR